MRVLLIEALGMPEKRNNEAALRLTLERMRTELANGTSVREARDIAAAMFEHNMRNPEEAADKDTSSPSDDS